MGRSIDQVTLVLNKVANQMSSVKLKSSIVPYCMTDLSRETENGVFILVFVT